MSDNKRFAKKPGRNTLLLLLYDLLILAASWAIMIVVYTGPEKLTMAERLVHLGVFAASVFVARCVFRIYRQVWRYGGIQVFIKLVLSDALAFCVYFLINRLVPLVKQISFPRMVALVCVNLLLSLSMRMFYRYAYKVGGAASGRGKFFGILLKVFSGGKTTVNGYGIKNTKIAIIGAGTVGVELAEDIVSNRKSDLMPSFFIDTGADKIGRTVHGLSIVGPDDVNAEMLAAHDIKQVVIAIPSLSMERKKELYEHYSKMNVKVMIYDYPILETAGKRRLREVNVEDLLFRQPRDINDERTTSFYKDKTVLVTGGGGSIGSELCRRVAMMKPRRLVVLDVYENCAYDLQQELRGKYGATLDLQVEICSVTNREAMRRVFARHKPNIVIMAAAHKHVPLMESNCIEAVENNVFGTLTTGEVAEEYGVERVIMVSTDKAVNPTNVMGATKRMCEMIVQAHSTSGGKTTFSATRFGNVLGSAGSVIPLFKRQIEKGGPVTLTDKRIIRYFMTIPEASQLVLQSGAMAKNGELFVLDMGEPVKILDLAENLIRCSGFEPYTDIDIVEVGLRPGEKLYEELLVKTEDLDKTDNELIFIERDAPLSLKEIEDKLDALREAVASGSDDAVREALRRAVPTFRRPEEVNAGVTDARERL
ncbi:MAG: polysaccharide biosynthesis protein [Clostridia bacterium]|nr:polysaccharide biosynthesis protein [Clostridia bacterium]